MLRTIVLVESGFGVVADATSRRRRVWGALAKLISKVRTSTSDARQVEACVARYDNELIYLDNLHKSYATAASGAPPKALLVSHS